MNKVAKVYSGSNVGLDSFLIEVEVDIGLGLPSFTIVGLPDKAIDESKERIRAAIKNSNLSFPQHRLTINLAPADVKKEGPSFDLPMTIGVLISDRQVEQSEDIEKSLFVGELSLNGNLRHVNGILPLVIYGAKNGFDRIYLPEVNQEEASIVSGIEIFPVKSLKQLVSHLRGVELIKPVKRERVELSEPTEEEADNEYDFAFVSGQEQAKRALEIAAAGNHNVFMSGPPGSGKTLLARSMVSIMPGMQEEEMIEVTKIYSVAGLFKENERLISQRPFRSPHHTTSSVALIGGGQWPRPGEISLSHRGLLFMDEFPEFPRSVLEALRQPLEDGIVTVSRAAGSLTFPADFLLVAAQNPCPCGYSTDPEKSCICTPLQVIKYQKKISGPLLDRFDLCVEVPRLRFDKIAKTGVAEKSSEIKKRVEKAKAIQIERFKDAPFITNSKISSKYIKAFCQLDEEAEKILARAVDQMALSGRVYHKILKVARTIADLEGSEKIRSHHLAEALQYRRQEKTY